MSTTVKGPKDREWPVPPAGLHQAVCVDVEEIWTEDKPAKFGGGLVDKTRLVFELPEELDDRGHPMQVRQKYTASLHPKSQLCQHLESWRGRPFTDEERAGFDLEKLVGVNAQIQVTHTLGTNGKTYANVSAIVPLGRGMVPSHPSEYFVRKKDQQPKKQGEGKATDDDMVPF